MRHQRVARKRATSAMSSFPLCVCATNKDKQSKAQLLLKHGRIVVRPEQDAGCGIMLGEECVGKARQRIGTAED